MVRMLICTLLPVMYAEGTRPLYFSCAFTPPRKAADASLLLTPAAPSREEGAADGLSCEMEARACPVARRFHHRLLTVGVCTGCCDLVVRHYHCDLQ